MPTIEQLTASLETARSMWRLIHAVLEGKAAPPTPDEHPMIGSIRDLVRQRKAAEAALGEMSEGRTLSAPEIDELCVNCHDLLTLLDNWYDEGDDLILDRKENLVAWTLINKIRAFTGPDKGGES